MKNNYKNINNDEPNNKSSIYDGGDADGQDGITFTF